MKIDYVQSIMALALTALLTWGAYALGFEPARKLAMAVAVASWTFISMVITIGIHFYDNRKGVMIKTVASSLLVLMLITDFIFSFFVFSIPLFYIINGVLLLIMLLIVRGIYRAQ